MRTETTATPDEEDPRLIRPTASGLNVVRHMIFYYTHHGQAHC